MTIIILQTVLGSLFGVYLVTVWEEYLWFSPRLKKLPRWAWIALGTIGYLMLSALLLKINL